MLSKASIAWPERGYAMLAITSRNAANSIEAIRERRKRTVAIVVYCAFGDESRDPSKQRVYAVAGAFGHQENWDALAG